MLTNVCPWNIFSPWIFLPAIGRSQYWLTGYTRSTDFIITEIGDSANSVTDSGWDSYLDDEEDTIGDNVTKFVLRFVDRVGTEAGIRTEHMKSLYAMIPGQCIFLCIDRQPSFSLPTYCCYFRQAKIYFWNTAWNRNQLLKIRIILSLFLGHSDFKIWSIKVLPVTRWKDIQNDCISAT